MLWDIWMCSRNYPYKGQRLLEFSSKLSSCPFFVFFLTFKEGLKPVVFMHFGLHKMFFFFRVYFYFFCLDAVISCLRQKSRLPWSWWIMTSQETGNWQLGTGIIGQVAPTGLQGDVGFNNRIISDTDIWAVGWQLSLLESEYSHFYRCAQRNHSIHLPRNSGPPREKQKWPRYKISANF